MASPLDRPLAVGIETFGCQMNVYDTAAIFGLLEAAGFRRAARPDLADILLLNTCSVREHAEQRVLSHLGDLRRRKREDGRPRLIGIVGCMAERLGRELLELPRGCSNPMRTERRRSSATGMTPITLRLLRPTRRTTPTWSPSTRGATIAAPTASSRRRGGPSARSRPPSSWRRFGASRPPEAWRSRCWART
jgi:hypothetical protein